MANITKEDLIDFKNELENKKTELAQNKEAELQAAKADIEKFAEEKRAEAEKVIDEFARSKVKTVNHTYEVESIKVDSQIQAIDKLLEKAANESLD